MQSKFTKTIKVELSTWGNPDYGKRVFRIDDPSGEFRKGSYVWVQDFLEWALEQNGNGIYIEVNPDEVPTEWFSKLNK